MRNKCSDGGLLDRHRQTLDSTHFVLGDETILPALRQMCATNLQRALAAVYFSSSNEADSRQSQGRQGKVTPLQVSWTQRSHPIAQTGIGLQSIFLLLLKKVPGLQLNEKEDINIKSSQLSYIVLFARSVKGIYEKGRNVMKSASQRPEGVRHPGSVVTGRSSSFFFKCVWLTVSISASGCGTHQVNDLLM
ncbi:hypothetical protein STEG23_024080, partial [Scotinomys teguina]